MKLNPGDKVTYVPFHLEDNPEKWEHGIVKRVTPNGEGYFVVYNCGGEWDRYEDYTAANTNKRDLRPGWIDKEAYKLLMPKGRILKEVIPAEEPRKKNPVTSKSIKNEVPDSVFNNTQEELKKESEK